MDETNNTTMAQQVTNYGRFYTLLKKLPCPYDKDELKSQLISDATGGRTTSLKEMTALEYNQCCSRMEDMTTDRNELKRKRSLVLKLMQKLGIDTTDWSQINEFCRHPRIAGKEFSRISSEELDELQKRLRTIGRKGWQRNKAGVNEPKKEEGKRKSPAQIILIQLANAAYLN